MEVNMARTANMRRIAKVVLSAAFVLASAAIAVAQPNAGAAAARTFPRGVHSYFNFATPVNRQFCYLPTQPCNNDHIMTN
jgi:hypothetical protein